MVSVIEKNPVSIKPFLNTSLKMKITEASQFLFSNNDIYSDIYETYTALYISNGHNIKGQLQRNMSMYSSQNVITSCFIFTTKYVSCK